MLWCISNRLAKARSLVEGRVWIRILAAAQEQAYAMGKLKAEIMASDSSLIDSKEGGESARHNGHKRRNGVKVHFVVSSDSFPLTIIIGAGNEHDSRGFEQFVNEVRTYTGRQAEDDQKLD